jgi:cell division septal protein FtsQ
VKKKIPFLIFTALILIFGGTYIYAFHSAKYNVAEIQIMGINKIAPDEIRKKADVCLGKNIFSLNLERIEKKLRDDLRIKDVRVERKLPDCISIEVQEKTPVLWISLPTGFPNQEDFGFYGLSIAQEIIPLEKGDLSHDLPLVSGIEEDTLGGRSVVPLKPYRKWSNFKIQKALEFYTMLLEIDPKSLELLAEINVADAPNLILYLLPYGNKVLLGSGDFERKWKRVKTILAAESKIEELTCLDLRFDDQVVLTRVSQDSSSSVVDSTNHTSDKKNKNLTKSRG